MHPRLAIHARALTKRYRRGPWHRFEQVTAVDGLDLDVPRGSTYGLLGPNGAGKTTTIHMILGLVRPTSGSVDVLGHVGATTAARSSIGYVPEKFELPPFLTARSFLTFHARLLGLDGRQRIVDVDRCLERVSLTDRADDPVATFSKGMQQRLVIAQAILGTPELVILDEPTSALDPVGRRDVRDLIRDLKARGTTVVLNSHLLGEVEQVCDDVAILQQGRLVTAHALEDRPRQGSDVQLRINGATPELLEALPGFVAEHGGVLGQVEPTSTSLEELFMHAIGETPAQSGEGVDAEVEA